MSTFVAVYDLEHGPVSYDFVTWLVRALREKNKRGFDRLHVCICPKEDGLGGFSRNWGQHDEAAARWRLWHIVVAACPIARATVSVCATRREAQQLVSTYAHWWPEGKAHFMGPIIEEAKAGGPVPVLTASDAAHRYVAQSYGKSERLVTFTLRSQTTDPSRNSNLRACMQLVIELEARYTVVVLQDSNEALAMGRGYAELDPDLRLALYERADMNICGNNGPQELLKFSRAPHLIFNLAQTEDWKKHFKKYFGMEPGDQLPWARPQDQRLIYEPDDYEVLLRHFSIWEEGSHGNG